MKDKKKEDAKRIAKDLGKLYKEMLDSIPLEDLLPFFLSEIRIQESFRQSKYPWALSDEKITMLKEAVEQYETIYEAEKAEAEKMPLSRHEAIRVKKLIDEINDLPPLPTKRKEH